MINTHKTYFNWSSGKDSALALYYMKQDKSLNIDRLLTSVNSSYDRVSMHGTRREMLRLQAESIGLPLNTIELQEEPSMEDYTRIMNATVADLKSDGYTHCGFGDIFLEDLKKYREQQLKQHDIQCVFPLWQKDTSQLIKDFIQLGFKSVVVCTNANLLDDSFLGRQIDENFINDLPANVDPCGENGEFHTFCFDGPIFSQPVEFELGEKIHREYKKTSASNSSDKENSDDKNTYKECSQDIKSSMKFGFCDIIPSSFTG